MYAGVLSRRPGPDLDLDLDLDLRCRQIYTKGTVKTEQIHTLLFHITPVVAALVRFSPVSRVGSLIRASPTDALNNSAVKALYSALYLYFAREAIFTSNRNSKFWSCKNMYLFLRARDSARSFQSCKYSARDSAFAPSSILQHHLERLLEH
jgi:hypothetical protein